MLEIKNIKKEYRTAGLVQMALDGVTMNLRDNEFVAVLGPSGSGKTTLLNIIGGLDEADSGELVINGVSTAKYRDRDWDTYRNHTIGFVFQSYNLIPHQNVLRNVELALTIGGVPASQRKARAEKALAEVGLSKHIHKLPMQLSGGQMQRVAIARALVNDPDIVLADEPTGALDSVTGIQVMDLLKKVAEDRLVVMVTHNPELAAEYATRIINLKDGKVIADSDPFDPSAEATGTSDTASASGAAAEQAAQEQTAAAATNEAADAAEVGASAAPAASVAAAEQAAQGQTAAAATNEAVNAAEVGTAAIASASGAAAEQAEREQTAVTAAVDTANEAEVGTAAMAASVAAAEKAAQGQTAAAVAASTDAAAGAEATAAETAAAESKNVKRAKSSKKASMSFLTALTLSFNNLMTKKGRTFLIAFAGSIGIIGIALIMSLSTGVNNYIELVEEETLSEYPLQIQDTGFDMTSIMATAEGVSGAGNEQKSGGGAEGGSEEGAEKGSGGSGSDAAATNGKGDPGSAVDEMDEYGKKISELKTITEIFSKSNSNDLKAFRKFLESDESGIKEYTSAIEYRYSIVPLIYRNDGGGKYRQVNPDKSFAAIGLTGSAGTSNSLMSLMMSTDSFNALPADERLYKEQYDVVAGHWPEDEHDLVLVLSRDGSVSDLVLYILGERDPEELEDAVKKFAKGEEVTMDAGDREYDSSFFMGQEFRLITNSRCYKYDAEQDVYIDKKDSKKYMNKVARKGEKLKIAGIVKPKDGESISTLTIGIAYHPDLVKYIIDQNKDSDIVRAQLEDRGRNVLTGKEFGDDDNSDFEFEDLVEVDKKKLESAFKFDAGKLKVDPKKLPQPKKSDFDFSDIFKSMGDVDAEKAMSEMMGGLMAGLAAKIQDASGAAADPEKFAEGFAEYAQTEEALAIIGQIKPESTSEDVMKVLSQLYGGYMKYAMENGLANEVDIKKVTEEYMQSEDAQKIIAASTKKMMPDMSNIPKLLQKKMTKGMANYMTTYTKTLMTQLAKGLKNAMSVNPEAFVSAIQMNMDEDDMTQMITQLMTTGSATYEDNMKNFGYADLKKPSMILLYPKNFDSKEKITDIIDGYNERMKEEEKDDKVITYSDIVGTLMSSVTDIINQLSMILIAFVAISLVVSSIMIGVITYISVLERKKEIGILRAMGASKGNVANVFNAETFIVGLLAGLLGIGLSYAILPLENHIIQVFSGGTRMHAMIPVNASGVLVLLSVVLTLIGGWIPSRKAAKSDPVTALRTE